MGKKLGLDKSYNALKITLGKYPLTSIGKNSPSSAFMSRALKLNTPPLVNSKLLNVGKKVFSKTPVGKGLNLALNVGKALKKTLTSKTNIGVSSAIAGFEAKNQIDKNPKVFDISLKEMIGKKTDKKMGGGMMQGYGAARTSGMGLEDQSLPPGKMVRANKGKMLSAKQKKIARMAPPPDEITGADFKAMKAKNGKMVKAGLGTFIKDMFGQKQRTASVSPTTDALTGDKNMEVRKIIMNKFKNKMGAKHGKHMKK